MNFTDLQESTANWLGRKLKLKTTNGKPNMKNAPGWATAMGKTPLGAWFWLEKVGVAETNSFDRYFPNSGKIEFAGYLETK